jgi:hypothetical protein
MLPKNKLGAELFRNLNVVVGQSTNKELKTKTVNLNDLKVMGVIHKIGRRKPLLHVFMFQEGTGVITVNKKTIRNLLPNGNFTVQSITTNVYDRM